MEARTVLKSRQRWNRIVENKKNNIKNSQKTKKESEIGI